MAFVIVDTDTMAFQSIANPAASAGGGAGVQAAQEVAGRGVGAVVTGAVGPNAYQVLAAARLPVYTFAGGTVREAVEAFRSGRLNATREATGPAHAGMGMTRGSGGGHGAGGGGRGMGGRGRRGGRGI